MHNYYCKYIMVFTKCMTDNYFQRGITGRIYPFQWFGAFFLSNMYAKGRALLYQKFYAFTKLMRLRNFTLP